MYTFRTYLIICILMMFMSLYMSKFICGQVDNSLLVSQKSLKALVIVYDDFKHFANITYKDMRKEGVGDLSDIDNYSAEILYEDNCISVIFSPKELQDHYRFFGGDVRYNVDVKTFKIIGRHFIK